MSHSKSPAAVMKSSRVATGGGEAEGGIAAGCLACLLHVQRHRISGLLKFRFARAATDTLMTRPDVLICRQSSGVLLTGKHLRGSCCEEVIDHLCLMAR